MSKYLGIAVTLLTAACGGNQSSIQSIGRPPSTGIFAQASAAIASSLPAERFAVDPLDDLLTPGARPRVWSELTPANSPSARDSFGMVFDAKRGVTVLFGGESAGSMLNDTWEWNGTTWKQKLPAASPSPRQLSAMAYDSIRDVTVINGGIDASFNYFDDTWEWDGTTWTNVSPATSPAARCGHTLSFDAARGNTVLFGGQYMGQFTNDTWTWDGTNWTFILHTPMPSPRSGHSTTYDEGRQVTVMFGGQNSTTDLNDTWEWDGTIWTEVSPATSPHARSGQSTAYDSNHHRIVLFGGTSWTSLATYVYNDVWQWTGTDWVNEPELAASPDAYGAGMVYSPMQKEMVLFGGADANGNDYGDTWVYEKKPIPTLISLAIDSYDGLPLGESYKITATGTYSDNSTKDVSNAVTWTTTAPAVGSLSQTGLFKAKGLGTTSVTATDGALTAMASVTVIPAIVLSLSVTPATANVAVGLTLQMKASGNYSDGSRKNLSDDVTWYTESSQGTVSDTGLFTADSQGSVTVLAHYESYSATAVVTVLPAELVSIVVNPMGDSVPVGQPIQYTATGTFTDSSTQDLTSEVTWSASKAGVATLSNTTAGLFTAASDGTISIIATDGDIEGSAPLTVN